MVAATFVLIGWCSPSRAIGQQPAVQFDDVAVSSGVEFLHENGATPDKYMPETMAAGGLIFDYDNDGWPDIVLFNGGSFVDADTAAAARHRLYRNEGDWTFTEMTEVGIGVSGFGMGGCSADYDNDGWVDLYITSVRSNRLYRNDSGAGFVDVTDEAGVGTELWSASCAFGDIDNDGDVDLYVTNYVDFDAVDNHQYCGEADQERVYCHPNVYNGLPDVLYRNDGDGTFTDITRESGVFSEEGKGLGVVFGDYDGDGWIDIYVANDSVANFLFHNLGGGKFQEEALVAGVAFGVNGDPLAGMGTDMGDINGDGLLDLFVTNLSQQTHNLYQNTEFGFFDEATARTGLAMATRPFVGFGAVFFDYDNDTDLDLAVANGDVTDNIHIAYPDRTYPQRNLLLENDGAGTFKDVGPVAGPGFALEKVSRGLAVGDLDNDGDLDVLIVNNGQTADLLRNEGGNRGKALLIRTIGTASNRDGIGARVALFDGDQQVSIRHVKAGSSYLGQSDLRVHVGLGGRSEAERIEILWPSGTIDVLESVKANHIVTVVEGEGVTTLEPFQGSR